MSWSSLRRGFRYGARLILLGLFAVRLTAQPQIATNVELFPQDRMVGRLNEVEVKVCNVGQQALSVQAIQVWSAVKMLGFNPANHVTIEEETKSLRGMSWQRRILLALAIGGFAFTTADQAGAFEIGNEENPARWKAAIPIFAGMIPVAMIFVQQKVPDSGQPQRDRMLPAAGFSLSPGQCGVYVMYGNYQR